MTSANATSTAEAVHCPECGHKGKKVQRITLESLLTPEATARIGEEQYRFCDAMDCDTVYFGENGTTFAKSDLTVRVGVKERKAPRHVCYCFDHTIEEIEEEVRETGTSTVLDDIKGRMKTACWCETMSPQGACCLGTVSRYIRKAVEEHGSDLGAAVVDEETADCCAAGAHRQSPNESEDRVMHDCCSNTDSDVDPKDTGQRTGMLAASGSILSAIAASACCWIPLLFIAFGVSAGGVAAWFDQYHWIFLGLTVLLLGAGFYFVYFRKPICAPDSACATPNRKVQRFSRAMLWTATIAVIAFAAFPYYVGALIPDSQSAQAPPDDAVIQTVTLDITGMTCEGCAAAAQSALVKVPGVARASVSFDEKKATVEIDGKALSNTDPLIRAVQSAGFDATAGATKAPPADPPTTQPATPGNRESKVIDVSDNEKEVAAAFTRADGKVRLLMILSPT